MAAGGSGAINQYIDRDLDKLMLRTAKRPLAAQRLTPAEGLAFGIGLCLLSFYLLAVFTNLLAAFLSVVGMFYYVWVYSILLKRSTVQFDQQTGQPVVGLEFDNESEFIVPPIADFDR